MKKPVPKMRRITLPVLMCCLPLQSLLAAAVPATASIEMIRPAAAISGRVVDEQGVGIPGVTVLVKGTSTGTQTDVEGRYSLEVPADATLIFSFVGYKTQEAVVGGRSSIEVRLATDAQGLGEVVVVGYLAQDRQNITSAVSNLDMWKLPKPPCPP